jgi:hypothetical protein
MKNLFLVFLTFIFISCGNGFKKEGNMLIGKMKLKNGESIEKEVSYKVDPYVIDTLKLDKQKVEDLLKEASIEAKASLKNPLSFDLPVSTENCGFIYSFGQDSIIKVSIEYIGQNGFGVKSKNTGIVEFDKKTLAVKNKIFI